MEHPRQRGRLLHHAQIANRGSVRGDPHSTRPIGGSRLRRRGHAATARRWAGPFPDRSQRNPALLSTTSCTALPIKPHAGIPVLPVSAEKDIMLTILMPVIVDRGATAQAAQAAQETTLCLERLCEKARSASAAAEATSWLHRRTQRLEAATATAQQLAQAAAAAAAAAEHAEGQHLAEAADTAQRARRKIYAMYLSITA